MCYICVDGYMPEWSHGGLTPHTGGLAGDAQGVGGDPQPPDGRLRTPPRPRLRGEHGNARIDNVGKYQSCMVSKLRRSSGARALRGRRDPPEGARIQLVGKSQSCMVSKLRMI